MTKPIFSIVTSVVYGVLLGVLARALPVGWNYSVGLMGGYLWGITFNWRWARFSHLTEP